MVCPTGNSVLSLRLTHTGVLADGRPNTASVLIQDQDVGYEYQTRKAAVYVPVGGYVDVPLTSRVAYSAEQGTIAGFVQQGILTVSVILKMRNGSDLGTSPLMVVNPNIQVLAGQMWLVIGIADAFGYVVGECLTITGLTGAFQALNGTFTIEAVAKTQDILGPNPAAFLIRVGVDSPDIASAQVAGVSVSLPRGRVTIELASAGGAGGFGASAVAYFGGDSNVMGVLDPKALQLTPEDATNVPTNSIFVDESNSSLSFKDENGVVYVIVPFSPGAFDYVNFNAVASGGVPNGSLFLDSGTNLLSQKDVGGVVTALGSGGGGGNWFQDAIWIDGKTLIPVPSQDGTMGKPFSTFAAAIAAAEAKQNALPVGVLPTQRCGTRQVFLVAGGIYDEAISILRGNTFYEFLAMGPVTLGDGAGADFSSTVPRSVTWKNSQAQEDADQGGAGTIRRPQLVLGTLVDMGESSSTHTAVACGWDISGDLVLTCPGGAGDSTTAELHLRNVRIRGNIDGSGDHGGRNCYFYHGRVGGTVSGTSIGGLLMQVVDSFLFEGLVTIGQYGRWHRCQLTAGMTVGAVSSSLPPGGFENCVFAGTFTRAVAGSANFVADEGTLYNSILAGFTLAGGATFQIMTRGYFPPTTGLPLDSPVAPGVSKFDSATNTLYIWNGTAWKSTVLV